jgi:hypothetical protein
VPLAPGRPAHPHVSHEPLGHVHVEDLMRLSPSGRTQANTQKPPPTRLRRRRRTAPNGSPRADRTSPSHMTGTRANVQHTPAQVHRANRLPSSGSTDCHSDLLRTTPTKAYRDLLLEHSGPQTANNRHAPLPLPAPHDDAPKQQSRFNACSVRTQSWQLTFHEIP